jgi:hypothetical protein
MPTIAIGAGVEIDLPVVEWTPLAVVHVLLVNAWARYRRAVAAWWVTEGSWFLLLLRLWREDKIELAARRGDPEAELRLLAIPISERLSLNFESQGPYSRIYFRVTETMLFDVCARAKAAAEPTSALAPAPPSDPHEILIALLRERGPPARHRPGWQWKHVAREVRAQMPRSEIEKLEDEQITRLDNSLIRFGQRYLARQRKNEKSDKSDKNDR